MVSFRRRYEPGFPRWTDFRPRGGVHRADRPVGQLVHPCRQLDGRPSDEACGLCDPGASRLVTLTVPFSDTAAASPPLAITPAPRTVLQITSGATRVARYARESVRDIKAPSRKFLPLQAAPGLVDGWLRPPDTAAVSGRRQRYHGSLTMVPFTGVCGELTSSRTRAPSRTRRSRMGRAAPTPRGTPCRRSRYRRGRGARGRRRAS